MASISNSIQFSQKKSNFYSSLPHKLVNRNLTNSIVANSKRFELSPLGLSSRSFKFSQLLKPRNNVDIFITNTVAADAEGHDIEITDGFDFYFLFFVLLILFVCTVFFNFFC